jgi:hypothetical protein
MSAGRQLQANLGGARKQLADGVNGGPRCEHERAAGELVGQEELAVELVEAAELGPQATALTLDVTDRARQRRRLGRGLRSVEPEDVAGAIVAALRRPSRSAPPTRSARMPPRGPQRTPAARRPASGDPRPRIRCGCGSFAAHGSTGPLAAGRCVLAITYRRGEGDSVTIRRPFVIHA